jgi:hypothetical protein
MGWHQCEFCPKGAYGKVAVGWRNVWIPAKEVVYIAPQLVIHYVEAHNYRPPDGFIEAVIACPSQGSQEFRNKMRAFSAWWVEDLDV